MSFSGIFARVVELIGDATIMIRHQPGTTPKAAFGEEPTIPPARPQGSFPTLKMPTARGWRGDEKPVAAAGLAVNAFARGLDHPRWIQVMPNGDVLVAEALFEPTPTRPVFDYAMVSTMRRAAATGVSPNRIMLLRDRDRAGVDESQSVFLVGLNQPFGMLLIG